MASAWLPASPRLAPLPATSRARIAMTSRTRSHRRRESSLCRGVHPRQPERVRLHEIRRAIPIGRRAANAASVPGKSSPEGQLGSARAGAAAVRTPTASQRDRPGRATRAPCPIQNSSWPIRCRAAGRLRRRVHPAARWLGERDFHDVRAPCSPKISPKRKHREIRQHDDGCVTDAASRRSLPDRPRRTRCPYRRPGRPRR